MAVFDDVQKIHMASRFTTKKIDLVNGQFVAGKPVPQVVDFAADEPLMLECQHFVDCIKTRRTPKTDGADGWRVLQVLEASQRSLNSEWRAGAARSAHVP